MYSNSSESVFASLLLIGIIAMAIILAVFVAAYVIQGLALSTVAKLEGKSEILAWIPVANIYLLFELTDTIPYLILIFFCSMFGTIGTIIVSIFTIFILFKWAKLCKRYGVSPFLIYVGILIPFLTLIPMFKLYKEAKLRLNS